MIGDFYRNYGYPFIDTNNGGSLKGALEGLDYDEDRRSRHETHPRSWHYH